MSKRINVVVSDRLNEGLDRYSEKYGVSKSSIVGFVLGQWLDSVENMNKAVYGVEGQNGGMLSNVFTEMMKSMGEKK